MTWTSSSGSETVGGALRDATETLRASGSESARLDAELLLGHVLHIDRSGLLAAPESPLGTDHVALFRQLVARRTTGEPVAYIRGIKEFYGLAVSVDSRALIPRPETELLVDVALGQLSHHLTERARPPGSPPLLCWDVATGSGAICVALAVESRRRGYSADIRFRATDVSEDALALATENAVVHGVADMMEFSVADLADLADFPDQQPADLLVANLPYIPSATVPSLPVAASFEPVLALDGGLDGLDLIRRLIDQLDAAVGEDGVALLEIGSDQADAVRSEVEQRLDGWAIAVHVDLAGLARVVQLKRGTIA